MRKKLKLLARPLLLAALLLTIATAFVSCGDDDRISFPDEPESDEVWPNCYTAAVVLTDEGDMLGKIRSAPTRLWGDYPTAGDYVRFSTRDLSPQMEITRSDDSEIRYINFQLKEWKRNEWDIIITEELHWDCRIAPAKDVVSKEAPLYCLGVVQSLSSDNRVASVKIINSYSLMEEVDALPIKANDEVMVSLPAENSETLPQVGTKFMFRALNVGHVDNHITCTASDILINPPIEY